MKILLIKKSVRCLIVASLMACPCLSSVTVAMPTSTNLLRSSLDNPGSNNSVSARNTTSPVAASSKTPKEQDKKAIGRCWKRLMTMVREVSHTQRKKPSNRQ